MIIMDYNPLNKQISMSPYFRNRYIREKRKLFLIAKCHLVSVEEMMELEINFVVTNDSGKKYQWMLRPVCKSLMRNGIFI